MIAFTEKPKQAARGGADQESEPAALVMVVDDQSTGRRILSQIIQGIGSRVEVVAFPDALSALDFMQRRPVDLILTDYVMPGMDGVSFIQRVRGISGHADVPIIVVTVVDDPDVRYRALDAGATDFLNRPVDKHECRARCRNLLTLRRQQHILRLRAQRLEHSERRFRTMADELPLMIWLLDAATGERFVNRTCREYFGLSDQDLDSAGWHELLHPEDRDLYLDDYQAAFDARKPFHGECRVRRADGEWRWLEVYARPYMLSSGAFGGTVGAGVDISERKLAEQALQESHLELKERGEQLARLASQLTLTEQRERRQLAKVLHDDLQQLLVGSAFGLDRVRRGLGSMAPDAAVVDALGHASEGLQQAIDLSRNLVADLTPLILHEAGLGEALEWLGRRMQERFGLEVRLDRSQTPPSLDEDLRSLVFDAVREALLNIAKHAECQEAWVALRIEDESWLVLDIEDHGVGFDTRRLSQRGDSGGGFGLFSMRERLGAFGGDVDIRSQPGEGTRILLRVPLVREQEVDEDSVAMTQPDSVALSQTEDADAELGAVRILLVDDHVMVRRALATMLEDEPDLYVVGEAADGAEALRKVERLHPDLVLMDFAMPRMDGVEATRRITERWPGVRVVGLSMYKESDRAAAMIAAGARAYLSKTGDVEELLATVRDVATGIFAGP